MASAEYLQVKSTLKPDAKGGEMIVLYEENPAHPDGAVKLYSTKRWTPVGDTARVREALTKGSLVEKKSGEVDPEPLKLEVREDDTVESLAGRYNRAQLTQIVTDNELEGIRLNGVSNKEVAKAILDGVAAKNA